MIAYDVNGDGKADVIDSSAHQFGIWWFEQGQAKDGSPDLHPARPVPGPRLRDARPDRRRHQRRRPEGPRHGQAVLVARQERAGLRQARPPLLVRGVTGTGRQDRLRAARDRRPERHRHPVRGRSTSTATGSSTSSPRTRRACSSSNRSARGGDDPERSLCDILAIGVDEERTAYFWGNFFAITSRDDHNKETSIPNRGRTGLQRLSFPRRGDGPMATTDL